MKTKSMILFLFCACSSDEGNVHTAVSDLSPTRSLYGQRSISETKLIDCHHDLQTCPLISVLSDFEMWERDGAVNNDLISKYHGKLVETGSLAKVLQDHGDRWIQVSIMTGQFTGSEGYVYRNCINRY